MSESHPADNWIKICNKTGKITCSDRKKRQIWSLWTVVPEAASQLFGAQGEEVAWQPALSAPVI